MKEWDLKKSHTPYPNPIYDSKQYNKTAPWNFETFETVKEWNVKEWDDPDLSWKTWTVLVYFWIYSQVSFVYKLMQYPLILAGSNGGPKMYLLEPSGYRTRDYPSSFESFHWAIITIFFLFWTLILLLVYLLFMS